MIKGIGVDMVEISRIRHHITHERFISRILTSLEYHKYKQLTAKRQAEYLAGRFAAKEAYAKAKGTGIGSQLSWQDIEVAQGPDGKPVMSSSDSRVQIHLSITHTKEHATAFVVIETRPS